MAPRLHHGGANLEFDTNMVSAYDSSRKTPKWCHFGAFKLDGIHKMNMNDTAKTFNLRIPPDLREWLDAAARKNMRSLNAEILFRLAQAKASEDASEIPGSQQN